MKQLILKSSYDITFILKFITVLQYPNNKVNIKYKIYIFRIREE